MARFTLKQIEAFLAVARKRNFAAAADELHISQPSVSVRIKELESALGIRVFERDHRVVALTPDGQLLHGASQRLSALSDEITHLFSGLTYKTSVLRIGLTDSFFLTAIKALSIQAKALVPDLHLDFKVGAWGLINDLLRRRRIEIGVLPDPVVDEDIERELLCVNQLGWFARKGHPISSGENAPGVLCDFDLIVYQFPSKIHTRATEWFKQHEIIPKRIQSSGSLHNMLTSVLYSDAIALLPDKFVKRVDSEGMAQQVLEPDPKLSLDLFICWQSHFSENSIEVVLDLVRRTAVGLYS